jgi:regulator of replication initiation timing
MPNNLDLDAIKRDIEDLSDETYLTVKGARQSLIEAVPALIAEVERLRQRLATAKKIGAAEELERMANLIHEANVPAPDFDQYGHGLHQGKRHVVDAIQQHAAELRAEVGE